MKPDLIANHLDIASALGSVLGGHTAAVALDAPPVCEALALPAGGAERAQLPSTKRSRRARRARPGWKPTLVRKGSFQLLRAIQKSSCDHALDLSCLSDACIALALELGAHRIVERALADLRADLRAGRPAPSSQPSAE